MPVPPFSNTLPRCSSARVAHFVPWRSRRVSAVHFTRLNLDKTGIPRFMLRAMFRAESDIAYDGHGLLPYSLYGVGPHQALAKTW